MLRGFNVYKILLILLIFGLGYHLIEGVRGRYSSSSSRYSSGGSRYSSRTSRYSSRTSRYSRTSRTSRYSSSISRTGSSSFTRATFRDALLQRRIYNSLFYYNRYKSFTDTDTMPTICTNNYDSDINGTIFGYFICPRQWESADYEYCCGPYEEETCCEYQMDMAGILAEYWYLFLIGGTLVLTAIMVFAAWCCKKIRLKLTASIKNCWSKKRNSVSCKEDNNSTVTNDEKKPI